MLETGTFLVLRAQKVCNDCFFFSVGGEAASSQAEEANNYQGSSIKAKRK